MFLKTEESKYKIIGDKKENVVSNLQSQMHNVTAVETYRGWEHYVEPMKRYDNSKVIKAGIFNEIYDYVMSYFDDDRKALRKSMNMLDKMNILLKGDPGSGKTHLACTLGKEIVDKTNGIGVVLNSIRGVELDELIDKLRINDESDRMIVMILDEMEKNPDHLLKDSDFLAFLDGAKSRENVILIATVNAIDELPDFLIERPGRFEEIYDFVFQSKEVLEQITVGLLPKEYKENIETRNAIVKVALERKTATVDHLRFLIFNYLFAQKKGIALKGPAKMEVVHSNTPETLDSEIATVKEAIARENAVPELVKKAAKENAIEWGISEDTPVGKQMKTMLDSIKESMN